MGNGKPKNIRNRNQFNWTLSEPSSPTRTSPNYLNTPQEKDSDLKSYLIQITEAFQEDINNTLKDRQENKGKKQVEALKRKQIHN